MLSLLGHGYIPTSSLREILRELDDQLTEQELDGILAEIDTDRSGTVDFDGNFTPTTLSSIILQNYLC